MVELRDNLDAGRLEMTLDGGAVYADYRRRDGQLIIDHVEAPPALRGTGAADQFMRALVERVRQTGERIVPLCGYAAYWLSRHPEPKIAVE